MARTGRRSGDTDTRGAILEAARAAFGELGYAGATIRGIAAEAGVDPALIHHYFGTKGDLYAAAIEMPIDPATLLAATQNAERSELGLRLARLFFTIWEEPTSREPLLGMLRGAMTGNDTGILAFRDYVTGALLPPLARASGGRNAELRVSLGIAQMVGIALMRYVVGVEPIASAPIEAIIELAAPRIQAYLDAEGAS